MPCERPDEDEDDDEWDAADEATVPCPYCEREIYEDAPRCPYCERYLSEEDTPPDRKPWWIIVGVLLCLYAVWRWIAG
jgi:transposase-like protein